MKTEFDRELESSSLIEKEHKLICELTSALTQWKDDVYINDNILAKYLDVITSIFYDEDYPREWEIHLKSGLVMETRFTEDNVVYWEIWQKLYLGG